MYRTERRSEALDAHSPRILNRSELSNNVAWETLDSQYAKMTFCPVAGPVA